MLNLAMRNLKIFFRQKSAVFFSLLGVFMIIGLYVLFLGDVWKDGMRDMPGIDTLLNSWIIAGIVSVTAITTSMGAFGIMIEDKTMKIMKDFYAAPLKRTKIVGGYIISAFVIGSLMSILALVLGEIFIKVSGGELLPALSLLKLFGILLLSVMMSSSMIFFIVSFINSNSAFTTASTVIGTLVGFLAGIYLPIGSLPDAVQWVVKLFPVSHTGAIMRQILMEAPIATSFAGAPESIVAEFSNMMGVTYSYGDTVATPLVHILVIAGSAVLFFSLAIWNVTRQGKKER